MPCMKKEGRILNNDDDIVSIVGKNIAKYRELKGLSQRQLAILCNIENSSVSKYESGKVEPKINALVKLAKVLEIRVIKFFEDPE
jgi:transcriptional regulator with XRE-family HTH domain